MPFTQSSKTLLEVRMTGTLRVAEGAVRVEGALYSHESCTFLCGYYLDKEQKKIVLNDNNYLLVTAGAGSGKTLTILGKINYLVKYKNQYTGLLLYTDKIFLIILSLKKTGDI